MKRLFLLLSLIFLISADTNTKECYKVTKVTTLVEAPEMKKERVLFGIKQITEEMLSEKVSICEDGTPVEVEIMSIEAPTTSTSFGPFAKEKKETIVKLRIIIGKDDYWGQGKANVTVKSTFLDLNDDNLPFSKTAFSGAVKKALQEAINEI
jgi:ribosomal protein S1